MWANMPPIGETPKAFRNALVKAAVRVETDVGHREMGARQLPCHPFQKRLRRMAKGVPSIIVRNTRQNCVRLR